VLLLYEGHQIFFGSTQAAVAYFTRLGFAFPERSTTADFLTSVTNPQARCIRGGYESRVPRTAVEFADVWKQSQERQTLVDEIEVYRNRFPIEPHQLQKFRAIQVAQKGRQR
jgi:predicted Zn-dependent protease